jgi:hypothetical protein
VVEILTSQFMRLETQSLRTKARGFLLAIRSNENGTVVERQFLLRGLFVETFSGPRPLPARTRPVPVSPGRNEIW